MWLWDSRISISFWTHFGNVISPFYIFGWLDNLLNNPYKDKTHNNFAHYSAVGATCCLTKGWRVAFSGLCNELTPSLPGTLKRTWPRTWNMGWLEYFLLSFWDFAYFQGRCHVSFRECIYKLPLFFRVKVGLRELCHLNTLPQRQARIWDRHGSFRHIHLVSMNDPQRIFL